MYDVKSLIDKAQELAQLATSRARKDFEISYLWNPAENIIVRNVHIHKYDLALYTEDEFIDAVIERFMDAQKVYEHSKENQEIIHRLIGDHGNTSLTMHFLDLVHPDSDNQFFVIRGIPDKTGKLEAITVFNMRGFDPHGPQEDIGVYSCIRT